MTLDDKLDLVLNQQAGMAVTIATMNVRVEYLAGSDVDVRSRVTALERWRFTMAGAGLFAGLVAQPLWNLLGHR
jgi:hypothetical protein